MIQSPETSPRVTEAQSFTRSSKSRRESLDDENERKPMKKKIRYAVIGLGHIAQTAVLPALKHAGNSELSALITGDPKKDRELSKHYEVKAYNYDDLESAVETEGIDAVYIATPNML